MLRRVRRASSGDREQSDIKLKWIRDQGKDPEMEITFADGKKDKILLAKSTNGGVDVPCLFSGALEKDHDSEVILFKLPNTPASAGGRGRVQEQC